MSFVETVGRARQLLEQNRRLSLRALKREFAFDDEALAELAEELVDVQRVAVREGNVLVWIETGERISEPHAPVEPEREGPGAERRQLTVLFCDLVGSTELSGRLDPEDWRELVALYQAAAGEVIARFGGHVAQHLGDGLLVYFGWPEAHDDDAERAVRAGLALIEVVRARDTRLEVRVGLHTGPVVVGEVGSGARTETLALGEVPNVAARVQSAATPSELLITAATQRLVAGLFLVEERSGVALKGVREPVVLHRVLRPSGVRRLATRATTAFVGREHERRLLLDRFERASEGDGQVVLIAGEPGIGKSRLAQMLHEDLAGTPHTWMETCGAPYFASTPFYAVTELLKQSFVWRGHEDAEARVLALSRALEAAGLKASDALPQVAPLLDLPLPPGSAPVAAAPEVARKRVLATLAEWVFGIARLQPLVVLLEDVHWVDPSTLELQQLLVDQGVTAPLLLLYTARPELRVPWPLRAHHTQLTLNRLGKKETRALALQTAARVALPAEVIEAVLARTDGVPLFVEELTKAAVEVGAASAHEIPPTLADSLMARLDRLNPAAKEVAQVAAVLGREFSYALLHAVHPLPEPELEAALARLGDAELVHARGLPPDATYAFKHALVQDAAYGSLLKSRRRELHGRVARVLAERFTELAEARPELLARHHAEAGEPEPAVAAFRRAAERALARGAHREAAQHVALALAALASLPEGAARDALEFPLQLVLGQALFILKGYGSSEANAAYQRARELSERVADPVAHALLILGLWASMLNSHGPEAAEELALEALRATERPGAEPTRVWGPFAVGSTAYFAGRFAMALEELERGLALDAHFTGTIDPHVGILSQAALSAWHLGRADLARKYMREACVRAEALGRPADRAWAGDFAASLHTLLREPEAVQRYAEAVLSLCAEAPSPLHEAHVTVSRGWALAQRSQVSEGLALMRTALESDLIKHGLGGGYLQRVGEGLIHAGDLAAAREALDAADATLNFDHRAETARLRSELLARTGADAPAIEAAYRGALATAARQATLALELRAGTSFARWLRGQGRSAEARALLAPVYARFTEGFDTRDLIDAKALLEELAVA